jgi:hypothetical protein
MLGMEITILKEMALQQPTQAWAVFLVYVAIKVAGSFSPHNPTFIASDTLGQPRPSSRLWWAMVIAELVRMVSLLLPLPWGILMLALWIRLENCTLASLGMVTVVYAPLLPMIRPVNLPHYLQVSQLLNQVVNLYQDRPRNLQGNQQGSQVVSPYQDQHLNLPVSLADS